MEAPESLEYYKLKDELGRLLKDEIAKSLNNERDLQQRYIGLGLKIAAAGIAAAVVTLGLFGIKSFYEVNSAIGKIPDSINKRINEEVTTRFNKNNPVARYEMILLESAARTVAASIATQAKQPPSILLDDPTSDIIVRALNDKDIKLETKLLLVDAISVDKLDSVSQSIEQAVVALTQKSPNDNPVDEDTLRRCLRYFSARNSERFAPAVERIYDARGTSSEISPAIARYVITLPKDRGEDLVRKLEKSDDPNLKYAAHIRGLTVGKVKQVDRELILAMLARSFDADPDDEIKLTDIIDHIESMEEANASTEVVAQFLEIIHEYATSKGLSLGVEDASLDGMKFRFYTAAGKSSSMSIDRSHFETLIELATDRIKESLRQSKGEFTVPITQAMNFWLPRSDPDVDGNSDKAGMFRYRDIKKVRFIVADGSETPGSTMSIRAFVTIQGKGTETKVMLKWNNEIGETKSMPIKTIVDFNARFLRQYGIWNRVSSDD